MQVKKQHLEPYMEQTWERSTTKLYIITLFI